MVPSQPMQSILDERWGNPEFSSVRMRRTLHVLLVPDYFALHNAPLLHPMAPPPLSTETPPVSFIYRDLLNLFLILICSSEAQLGTRIE